MACPSGFCVQPPTASFCGPSGPCGVRKICYDTVIPFSKYGFYPLYYDSWSADAISPQGTSHSHTYNNCIYYMPNGLVRDQTYFHGGFREGDFSVAKMIRSTAQLSMFYSALLDTGIVSRLRGPKNYTVFAPTNEAWLRLPDRFISMLFLPKNAPTLRQIVEYHIIGTHLKTLGHGSFKTLEGESISLTTRNACTYKVNGVDISTRLPNASNGEVYIIHEVLLPSTLDIGAPL